MEIKIKQKGEEDLILAYYQGASYLHLSQMASGVYEQIFVEPENIPHLIEALKAMIGESKTPIETTIEVLEAEKTKLEANEFEHSHEIIANSNKIAQFKAVINLLKK